MVAEVKCGVTVTVAVAVVAARKRTKREKWKDHGYIPGPILPVEDDGEFERVALQAT